MSSIATQGFQIERELFGFDDGANFRLENDQVWQQCRYTYRYHYAYRPEVELRSIGGEHFLFVPCMNEEINVVRVNIVVERRIVSGFAGFSGEGIFEFDNDQIWKQDGYRYAYHYAYWPEAIIIDGLNGLALHVDDMGEGVRVRRVK